MPIDNTRYCRECRYCIYHKKGSWYECKLTGEETGNYDTCEDSADIIDDYDEWPDEPYERKKYETD